MSEQTCLSCGKPIAYNGQYWVHTTYSPRHPAVPLWSGLKEAKPATSFGSPKTMSAYVAKYLDKWHAGLRIGNQSFVLNALSGTEEEAKMFAEALQGALDRAGSMRDCSSSKTPIGETD